MITIGDTQRHLSWPAERFYWAVLDAPALTRAGELPIGLRSALEEEVPDDAAELHAVCMPLTDGRVLACAAQSRDLKGLDGSALSLTPESLPGFAAAPADAAAALNLLVGPFAPRRIRRARDHRHILAMASVLLCVSLICLGLVRRAVRWEAAARQAGDAATVLLAASPAAKTPETVARELDRLRRTVGARSAALRPSDAALAFSSLLNAWPAQAPSKPQSITINPAGISLSVAVEGDPTPFLAALKPPAGWTPDEPRLNTAGNLTRLNIVLRRKEGGS